MLLGLVCSVLAVLHWGSPRVMWFIGAAMVLACLGGFELALREHLSGQRSRSWVLAGALGVAASAGALLAGLAMAGAVVAAAATVLAAGTVLERTFARRQRAG